MTRVTTRGTLAVGLALAAATAGCTSATTAQPLRSFARAQKVDFVCLEVNDANGNALLGGPIPVLAAQCPPVPPNISGTPFQYHYYAEVTQASSGQVAVVDITAGAIVDVDRSQPGVNLIPVGAVPTDIAVTPDAKFTYVASGDPNSPALYAIDNRHLLGDSQGIPNQKPPKLTDLLACSLPQPPDAVAITTATTSNGGVAGGADGGSDAGAPCGYSIAVMLRSQGPQFPAQVWMIEPLECQGAQPGALQPCTLVGGSTGAQAGKTGALSSSVAGASFAPGPTWPDGVPYANVGSLAAEESSPGPQCVWPPPGADAAAGVAPFNSGDAGSTDAGTLAADGGSRGGLDAGATDALAEEVNADAMEAPDAPDLAPTEEAGFELDGSGSAGQTPGLPGDASASLGTPAENGNVARPTAMVLRDLDAHVLYVADGALPLIHVIDISNPAAPVEKSSFLATSAAEPTRVVSIGGLALSDATRNFDPVTGRSKRYLYAIDQQDGTLMVYDATDPIPAPFTPPLQRPHPELDPFSPADRIAFSAPVTAVGFVQNDWPLPPQGAGAPYNAYSGLLCNPSPNARTGDGGIIDYGAFYCADETTVVAPSGAGVEGLPSRLRGSFAFAILSNGSAMIIDVDDWDAPCRRPDPMAPGSQIGALDLPVPDAGAGSDLDPYHVPFAFEGTQYSAVTQEVFFPVSAPNRPRSAFLLRNDPSSGKHMPYVLSTPQFFNVNGAPVAAVPTNSVILPTALDPGMADPSTYTNPVTPNPVNYDPTIPSLASAADQTVQDGGTLPALLPGTNETTPGIRVSFDDPVAHVDQDWTVTYEGAIPSTSAVVANLIPQNGYQSLLLSLGSESPDGGAPDAGAIQGGGFCEIGVEDWDLGKARATQALAAMVAAHLPATPVALDQWTSDYVEITDDILASNDCYWSEGLPAGDGGVVNGCPQGPSSPDGAEVGECWDQLGFDDANSRYQACADAYGAPGADKDQYLARDFPILQAYDSALVVGRFNWTPTATSSAESTTNRVIVGSDPSNEKYLRYATCCFHHQAGFKIRTGGEWVTVASTLGMLHHIQTDATSGRCVSSCDPEDALKNARAFDVPYAANGACGPPATLLDRTSSLAMRNPMFSFVMWSGCSPNADATNAVGDHTLTQRDLSWHFSVRGGFSPLTVSLGGTSGTPVVPQSIRQLAPAFSQLAVVDGADQGLILIDLHTLAFAHNPYF